MGTILEQPDSKREAKAAARKPRPPGRLLFAPAKITVVMVYTRINGITKHAQINRVA